MLLMIHWLVPSQRKEFRENFARPDEQEPIIERETGHETRTLSVEAIRVSPEVEVIKGGYTGETSGCGKRRPGSSRKGSSIPTVCIQLVLPFGQVAELAASL